MARITVEDCLTKVENRFALVLLVAKRAKQLLKGSETTLPSKENKYVVTALREVAAGNVAYDLSETDSVAAEIEKDLTR
ncbi:MAG: DNA-directed RNA polymerase subunit omega [Proteobacteria bacterium SG_bin7]|nr:MAG: DNA-directed RNA polymerase subunit omega [Proteobacteria bacterium SG_bin7]